MALALRAPAAVVAAAFIAAGNAAAQDRLEALAQGGQTVSLMPASPGRWDGSVHIGWLGINEPRSPRRYETWYEAAAFGASMGYYWTPHLKVEVDLATTTAGRAYEYDQIFVPGQVYPFFLARQNELRRTSASAGMVYQFFENRWFHPFLGIGVDAARDRIRTDEALQGLPPRTPPPSGTIPVPRQTTAISYTVRPFAAGGFKAYMSEQAFFRTDLRLSLSSNGTETAVLRAGFGVDF